MGDFLGRLGSEFKLGQTNGPMMTSQVKMPDMDLGNGMVIPGGTQAIEHPSARPTFLTSFLANLPSAIAGGVANSQHPGGGFATGLAGGFQGIEQHNLLMTQLQNQGFERQLQQSREQREQGQFELSKEQLKQQAALNRFQIERDPTSGDISVFDKQKALELANAGLDVSGAVTRHNVYTSDDIDKLDTAIRVQAGIDLTKMSPLQQAAHSSALAEAERRRDPKAIQDFYNKAAAAEQAQNRFTITQGNQAQAGVDKSYDVQTKRLDKLGEPIADSVKRMGRLVDTINQSTPQADALVAPELLTVMAGGQGSGLRMNEAEIARIVGGRSNAESLKASLNKWQADPTKALSITPAQRQQIKSLVSVVNTKLLAKQKILDDANDQLLSASSVAEHRKIVNEAKRKLTAIDEAGALPAGVGAPESRPLLPGEKVVNQ